MEKIAAFCCLFLMHFAFGQDAESLNVQSKELLAKQEFAKALPILRQAADLGNAEAQYNLGYCLENGIGTLKNDEEAAKWYKLSSDNGFNDGHSAMMMAHAEGRGVQTDFDKAFAYAMKCAQNDDATCMWNVVNCYKQGMGTAKDNAKMLEWATRLARLENPESLTLSGKITSTRLALAYMYRDGDDLPVDPYRSYLWFLIYNEFKRDFSVIQQTQIVDEIKAAEKNLSKAQLETAQKDAETLLGRKLVNMANLYKADM